MKTPFLACALISSLGTPSSAQESTLQLPPDCSAFLNMEVSESVGNIEKGVYDIIFCYGNSIPTGVSMQESNITTYGNLTQIFSRELFPDLGVGEEVNISQGNIRSYIGRTQDEEGSYFYNHSEGRVGFILSQGFNCYQSRSSTENIEFTSCNHSFSDSMPYSDEGYFTIHGKDIGYEDTGYLYFRDIGAPI